MAVQPELRNVVVAGLWLSCALGLPEFHSQGVRCVLDTGFESGNRSSFPRCSGVAVCFCYFSCEVLCLGAFCYFLLDRNWF